MRLWSLHPRHLDKKGLGALWREGLLAQKVLEGGTKGYRNHPQLDRFKQTSAPLDYIRVYLHSVADEAMERGYNYNRELIGQINGPLPSIEPMLVSVGQLEFELQHLKIKLFERDANAYWKLEGAEQTLPHPLFNVIDGGIESWEKL